MERAKPREDEKGEDGKTCKSSFVIRYITFVKVQSELSCQTKTLNPQRARHLDDIQFEEFNLFIVPSSLSDFALATCRYLAT